MAVYLRVREACNSRGKSWTLHRNRRVPVGRAYVIYCWLGGSILNSEAIQGSPDDARL